MKGHAGDLTSRPTTGKCIWFFAYCAVIVPVFAGIAIWFIMMLIYLATGAISLADFGDDGLQSLFVSARVGLMIGFLPGAFVGGILIYVRMKNGPVSYFQVVLTCLAVSMIVGFGYSLYDSVLRHPTNAMAITMGIAVLTTVIGSLFWSLRKWAGLREFGQ